MAIPTTSYELIAEKYDAAIRWMEGLGVKLSPGRTRHYAKVVEHWRGAYPVASEAEAKDIFPDFVSSMFEIAHFIEIYEAFKFEPIPKLFGIVQKLQKGVNGPINSVDETPNSTIARNYIFEALMAARSHRPQSGVETIFDSESDTGIHIQNRKVWVECKRITSIEKIEANARDASKQLETFLKKKPGAGHRGLVAIDITKILDPGDKIFVQQNDAQLLDSVDGIMDRFIKEYSPEWERVYARRHRKVIGTIIHFSFMASSEERGLLVHTAQWAVNPRFGIRTTDEILLRSLVQAVKGIGP